jgi:alpha-N-arabinofuranosidase
LIRELTKLFVARMCSGRNGWLQFLCAVVFTSGFAPTVLAQANLPAYTDHLVNGFQDYSWAPRNLANTSTIHSGSDSISVSAANWQALQLHHGDFDTSLYASLSFWINGGASSGQKLQVQGVFGGAAQTAYVLPTLTNNVWLQFTIPLATLGIANKTNCNGFWIQLQAGGSTNTFYVDDIQWVAKPAPLLTHITVNAAQALRTVDARMFGVNTAIWDGNFDTPETLSLVREMGCLALRFPGGSLSDEYHWATGKSLTNTWSWATSFNNFVHVATNSGAHVFITVNYGTGTPTEAANWVRNANLTNHYAFKYWEIGNEVYGTWETDSNSFPNDAYTYALRAKDYIQQMKAADPAIKIGIVATPGESSFSNGYTNHPAYNSRTGQTNYGWTPVLLTTLKNLGVTPDFLIHHRYPEYTDSESDPFLLQDSVGWAGDAADLRQQLSDYWGPGGTNIELACTENNSNAGKQGKQSVSLVNALYYADSLGQLMKTELNSLIWWDLRNGRDTSGSMDPVLYGWRLYGDLGMIDSLTTRYPDFYAAKLMQYFARPGDSVLNVSSDYALLSGYAVRRTNGAVTLLMINKDPSSSFTGQIAVNGFIPNPMATINSYGIPQDNAAQTGTGSPDIAQTNFPSAGTNFTFTFPPYSLTLFALAPANPKLVALAPVQSGHFPVQLQGQTGVRYVLQTSTNLTTWTPVSTNTLTAPALNLTNSVNPGAPRQFWRAIWQQ